MPETSLFEVNVEAIFPAAHALRNYYGKTEPIHGHNWKMRVTIEGPRLDSMGLLIDFIGLKKSVARVLSRLDTRSSMRSRPSTSSTPRPRTSPSLFTTT